MFFGYYGLYYVFYDVFYYVCYYGFIVFTIDPENAGVDPEGSGVDPVSSDAAWSQSQTLKV